MAEFIKNSPFRFWCQKVLPLVYDDSLSYYELLCKVVGKLNELAENQNNLSDEIKEVAKDLNDFKTQVPDMVEAKVEEWLNNYITTHGLVNSVNGMTGVVTLTAADVGAIANVNGSVKNNNIADGAVTADKMASGVIPTKLPNPQKLTFSGAVTGEYDGSQAVNIDIPAGGGGGGGNAPLTFTGAVDATYDGTEAVTVNIPQGGNSGAVDSVNGMTGAVVLKKLTANEGLSMSGGDGYNGSAEQSVGIADGGVSNDKIADGAITSVKIADGAVTASKIASGVVPTKLPNPYALSFVGAANVSYDGSEKVQVTIPKDVFYAPLPDTIDDKKYHWSGNYACLKEGFGCIILFGSGAAASKGTHHVTFTLETNFKYGGRGGATVSDAMSLSAACGYAEAVVSSHDIAASIYFASQADKPIVCIPFVRLS